MVHQLKLPQNEKNMLQIFNAKTLTYLGEDKICYTLLIETNIPTNCNIIFALGLFHHLQIQTNHITLSNILTSVTDIVYQERASL